MARIYRTYALKRNFLARHASDSEPEKPKPPKKSNKPKKAEKKESSAPSPALGPLGTQKKRRNYKPYMIGAAVILLVLAVGFVQAAIASRNMVDITLSNRRELKAAVAQTTATVQNMKMDDPKSSAKALESIASLSSIASQKSDTCKNVTKPTIRSFARDYDRIYEDCQNSAAAGRAVMESSNAMLPLATYQVALHTALKPVIDLQRGDDKADIEKTLEAWKSTRSELRKVTAPNKLTDINGRILTVMGEITESLDAVVGESDPTYSQLQTAESELAAHYKKLNQEGANIEKQLTIVQKQLTEAAKLIK